MTNDGNSTDSMKALMASAGIDNIVQDVEKAFYDIPFENSAFQNINFVVNQQLTPARAYRAIGLRISAKVRALKEAYFGRQIEDIDIAELEAKRDNPDTTKWDRMRAEVEIQKKLSNRNYTDKLINDAVCEINTLYAEMKKLPRYSRSEFEAEERSHFEIRLQNQLNGIQGAGESLLAMTHSVSESALALAKPAPDLISN